jgi:hypothetical protein
MRKKTTTRIMKHPKLASSKVPGLIAKAQSKKRSAEAKPILDNRSHRTITSTSTILNQKGVC